MAMQAALQAHDQLRRATDLPPFHGIPSRDTISARQLLDRMTHAARVAHWDDDAAKIDNFYLLLRDRALVWWAQLVYEGVDVANWNTVKEEFLATYEPKYSAKTTCTNFGDLVQRMNETAHDYYLRVCEAMTRICEAKPAALNDVRTAVGAAAAAADRQAIKAEGILDAEKFFRHQLFLAGLRDPLRTKIMEANKDTIRESVKLANELETIHLEKRRVAVAAIDTSIEETAVNAVAAEDDLDDEEFSAVNAIRQRNGKAPFRRAFPRNGGAPQNGASNGTFGGKCRYCKKPGHIQKFCQARIKARAPMVDKDGKPFQRRITAVENASPASAVDPGVASVNVASAAVTSPNENSVGSVLASALGSLNW